MAGFFSKLGAKADELASAAAEKATELKEVASEKIDGFTKEPHFILTLDNNDGKIKIVGTKDEIFNFLKENGFVKDYYEEKEDDE